MPDQFLTPSTLKELNLVSNPAITAHGRRVLYTVAKPNLDLDIYESTVMMYDADTRRITPLQQGPGDACPIPAPDLTLTSSPGGRSSRGGGRVSHSWR